MLVLAQSFGAALAVRLAAERRGEVGALALLNPYLFDARLLILPVARRVKRTAKAVGDDIALRGVTEIALSGAPGARRGPDGSGPASASRPLSNVTAPCSCSARRGTA